MANKKKNEVTNTSMDNQFEEILAEIVANNENIEASSSDIIDINIPATEVEEVKEIEEVKETKPVEESKKDDKKQVTKKQSKKAKAKIQALTDFLY